MTYNCSYIILFLITIVYMNVMVKYMPPVSCLCHNNIKYFTDTHNTHTLPCTLSLIY